MKTVAISISSYFTFGTGTFRCLGTECFAALIAHSYLMGPRFIAKARVQGDEMPLPTNFRTSAEFNPSSITILGRFGDKLPDLQALKTT